MPNVPLIIARQLGMSYGDASPILKHVELSVARGEFVSIVGPSGCGKSTLLRLVAGLREPTVGQLTIADAAPGRSQTKAAFVFQEPNLLPWRTVTGNIRLPLELDGSHTILGKSASDELIEQAIRRIGLLPGDAAKRPAELSGGMRMRVSLARALVTDPQIMLLDEPFAALDDILRQQLNEELQRLWWNKRWTGLFVTHNVSEAVFLSQRVLVMSRAPGTILETIDIPFDFPRSPELRAAPEFASLTGVISAHLRRAAGISESATSTRIAEGTA
ncbi:MAG: ABC transporter ATP-binding protein [Planctomycetota bacterium]|nr:ABC transporter ATP-binding protein [Planctomycetota bacterium]MDA1162469.1 ABC transporter ATP-binding protein [Planctomycetota bacterium]